MVHHTKNKGDLAVAKTIVDLTEKDYIVCAPVICEHAPFDLVVIKGNDTFKIQVKYVSQNVIRNKRSWSNRNGCRIKKYAQGDFEYYAAYYPIIDKVLYPHFKFGGCKIRTTIPNSGTRFYWWEDFTEFTDEASKKSYKEFGKELTSKRKGIPNYSRRIIERPSAGELHKLLWEKPTVQVAKGFGVSGKAIEKWAKAYNIEKPPRGYWAKKKAGKI